jgi:DNA-binding XRE family transcriptional regulator
LKDKKELIYSFDFGDEQFEVWDLDAMFSRHVLIEADGLPVADQLRIKRCHDELTQGELADKLGMSTSTLCEYEKGRRRIATKYWPAIYSYLYREYYYGGVLTDIFDEF